MGRLAFWKGKGRGEGEGFLCTCRVCKLKTPHLNPLPSRGERREKAHIWVAGHGAGFMNTREMRFMV